MKPVLTLLLAVLAFSTYAKEPKDSATIMLEKQQKFIDSVESSLKFKTGDIPIPLGFAKLNVPVDFKYLDAEQSNFILTEVWGNPPQKGILGMIFPKDGGPFSDSSYAFVITYDEMGYVKDDDADKIKYDELLAEMQKDETEENKTRVSQGYAPIHMVGWAAPPFYDKTNKVLHWAKNLKFGDAEVNTLNYEVRILGRKGVLSLNAIASMNDLDLVKSDIDKVLKIPSFTAGNTYKEFDSNVDKVAVWTIGGLVAGKVLLKVGFWAVLGKFFIAAWKFIVLGVVGAWGVIKKFFRRKTESEEEYTT